MFFPLGCTPQFFMVSALYVYPEVCTPHFFLPCLLQALPIGVCLTRPSLNQGLMHATCLGETPYPSLLPHIPIGRGAPNLFPSPSVHVFMQFSTDCQHRFCSFFHCIFLGHAGLSVWKWFYSTHHSQWVLEWCLKDSHAKIHVSEVIIVSLSV